MFEKTCLPREDFRRRGFWLARGLLDTAMWRRILEHGMSTLAESQIPNRLMNPHRTDALFTETFRHPQIINAVEEVFDEEAVGVQTMFYIKPPKETGHGWHQDQNFIAGSPKPILAAWCALDKIDAENGALVVYPGSHTGGLCEMVANDSAQFARHAKAVVPPPKVEPLTVEMEPGDVLFFDGFLIHGSYPNRSDHRFRRAWVAHYLARGSTGSRGDRPIVQLHDHPA